MPLDKILNAWVSDVGFQPEMVRGLIRGLKTHTRRLETTCQGKTSKWFKMYERFTAAKAHNPDYCEYLYVREGFAKARVGTGIVYLADYKNVSDRRVWNPSIHLPRKYSRLTLEVIDVRREKIQDISEDDALAEGIALPHDSGAQNEERYGLGARENFKALWNSIHGKTPSRSWADNPSIIVIIFKVHHGNINGFKVAE